MRVSRSASTRGAAAAAAAAAAASAAEGAAAAVLRLHLELALDVRDLRGLALIDLALLELVLPCHRLILRRGEALS